MRALIHSILDHNFKIRVNLTIIEEKKNNIVIEFGESAAGIVSSLRFF